MTFADRILAFLGNTKAAELPQVGHTVAARQSVPSLAKYKLQITEGLYKNSAVQGCITALSTTLNEAPVIVTRADGEYIPSHPLERLFARPNPFMSGSQFWRYVSIYLYTGGNVYIHKVRSDITNAVVELYPYNAGQMVPIPSQYGWIEGYNYAVDGATRFVPAKDVIHIKWTPDPLNPTVGLSPIDIAGAKIQALNEIDLTIYSQMKNNGVPGHMMFLPTIPTQQQTEALREMWAEAFTGNNRGKLGVVSGNVRVERMAQNMSELQAEGLYGQLESAICGVFRVHPVVAMVYAGLLSSTYSNMETAFREFTTLTRVPTWKDWSDQLTLSLRDELNGNVLAFDTTSVEALKSDPDAVIYPVIAMFNANLITQNEARDRTGQSPIPEGDRYAFELTQSMTGVLSDTTATQPIALDGTYDTETNRLVIEESKAFAAWKMRDDITQDFAKRLEPYVIDMITEAGRMAIRAKSNPDANRIDTQELINRFMASTGDERRKLIDQIMTLAVADVNADFSEVQSFVDEVTQSVTRQSVDNLSNATATVKKQIANAIDANQGKPVSEIAAAINAATKGIAEARAKMIAQTVVAQQTSTTQQNTWERMNKNRSREKQIVKVWVTMRDDRVRDSHKALDGKVVELGDNFKYQTDDGEAGEINSPGLAPKPSDFVACRCIIAGVERRSLA